MSSRQKLKRRCIYSLDVFTDIEGVFNYTSFTATCDVAIQHEIDTLLVNWILHMLEDIRWTESWEGRESYLGHLHPYGLDDSSAGAY